MHKRVKSRTKASPGLRYVEFCSFWKDGFLCVYILYFILFIDTAFESLEFARYFRKNKIKGLFVSKLNST